jgi:hypothetical protein
VVHLLVSGKTLATLLDIKTPETIRKWAKSGAIPAVRISPRCFRYDPFAVKSALEAKSKAASATACPEK